MSARTYYDKLQVSRYASLSVIRAAYKALSQKHHPDKNLENEQTARVNMQRLNEAFEVLSDEKRKASYDNLLDSLDAAQQEIENKIARDRSNETAYAQEQHLPSSQAAKPKRDVYSGNSGTASADYRYRPSAQP